MRCMREERDGTSTIFWMGGWQGWQHENGSETAAGLDERNATKYPEDGNHSFETELKRKNRWLYRWYIDDRSLVFFVYAGSSWLSEGRCWWRM